MSSGTVCECASDRRIIEDFSTGWRALGTSRASGLLLGYRGWACWGDGLWWGPHVEREDVRVDVDPIRRICGLLIHLEVFYRIQ